MRVPALPLLRRCGSYIYLPFFAGSAPLTLAIPRNSVEGRRRRRVRGSIESSVLRFGVHRTGAEWEGWYAEGRGWELPSDWATDTDGSCESERPESWTMACNSRQSP